MKMQNGGCSAANSHYAFVPPKPLGTQGSSHCSVMSLRLSEQQQLDMLRLMSVSGSSPMTVWVIGLNWSCATCGWCTGHSGLQGEIIQRRSWFCVREDLAAMSRPSSLHIWVVTSEKVFIISTIRFISLPYHYVISQHLLTSFDNPNHYRFQSTFRFGPLPTAARKKRTRDSMD